MRKLENRLLEVLLIFVLMANQVMAQEGKEESKKDLITFGGQNIPNDVSDLDEDLSLKAKTIPVTFGAKGARMLIMGSLCAAVVMSIIILALKPQLLNFLSLAGAAGAGLYLLLLPAYNLYRSQNNSCAVVLFNRASYYPLAMLVIITINIMFVAG